MQTHNRSLMIPMSVIFFIAVLVRMIYLSQMQSSPFYSNLLLDSEYYDKWAREITEGNFIKRGGEANLLYPVYLSLIYRLLGHSYFFPRLFQMLLDSTTCLLMIFLARRYFPKHNPWIGAFLYAVYLPAVYFSGTYLAVALIPFLCSAFVLLLEKAAAGNRPLLFLFSGLICGTAVTGRPNMILVVPWAGIWFLTAISGPLSRKMAFFFYFLAGFSILFLPPVILNRVHSGSTFLPTHHGGINFYIGNNPQANGTYIALAGMSDTHGEITRDSIRIAESITLKQMTPSEASRFWMNRAFQFISDNPLRYVRLLLLKCALFWNGEELPANESIYFDRLFIPILRFPLPDFYLLAPFAIAGIVLAVVHRTRTLLPILVIASTKLSLVLFFVTARYRMPVMPFMILFAGYCISVFHHSVKRRKAIPCLLIAAGVFAASRFTNLQLYDRNLLPGYFNLAKVYLRDNRLTEAELMCRRILADSDSAKTHHLLATILMKKSEYVTARDELQKAIQIDPLTPGVFENLGFVYFQLGNPREALDAYRKSMEANNENYSAYYNTGLIYIYLNDMNNAARYLEEALLRSPPAETRIEILKQLDILHSRSS